MKILALIITIAFATSSFAGDRAFITGVGSSYQEARNSASKVARFQSMKIIGQNHSIDKNGNWTVVIKVRPLR